MVWGGRSSRGDRQRQNQRCPAAAAGWNTDRGAENKSKADAQKPYIQGGQEGTDKGFHYLKGRERETLGGQTGTPTTERKSMQAPSQSDMLLHSKPKAGG